MNIDEFTIKQLKDYAFINNIKLDYKKLTKKIDIYEYILSQQQTISDTNIIIDDRKFFIPEIWNIICDYIDGDIKVKLLEDKVNKYFKPLCSNPSAIYILERNIKKINWYELSKNKAAIHLLEKYPDKIIYSYLLSENPIAFHILQKNQDKIDWSHFSSNTNPLCLNLFQKNLDKLNWLILSRNPIAIPILEQNPNKIDWYYLSENPSAIHLLEKNIDKINWKNLSKNTSINLFDKKLLDNNIDKLDFVLLSQNPSAINILEDNIHRIDWTHLCYNTSAIKLIEENMEKVYFGIVYLNYNKSAIKLLEKYPDKIQWNTLSMNQNLHLLDNKLLEKNSRKLKYLHLNTSFWNKYPDKLLRNLFN